jgi:hypothetical protein
MSSLSDRIDAAIAEIERLRDDIAGERDRWRALTGRLDAIVNGPAEGPDSIVATSAGDVKTAARVLAQAAVEMSAARQAYEAETIILRAIVNGPAEGESSMVQTDSGIVPTIARQVKELKESVQAGTLEALGAAPASHSHDSLDAVANEWRVGETEEDEDGQDDIAP